MTSLPGRPSLWFALTVAGAALLGAGHAWADSGTGFATEWGRALERILIVAIGGTSIYFGYRLFHLVSDHAGELAAKGAGVQIRLLRIGPGIFFAFFGASIVVYSMSQATRVTSAGSGGVVSVRGALPTDSAASREQGIRSLAGLIRLGKSGTTTLDDADRALLAEAARTAEPLLSQLVDAEFGTGAYAEWHRLIALQGGADSQFAEAMSDPRVRERFQQVDESMSQRVEP